MRYYLIFIGFIVSLNAAATDLRPDYPQQYTIQPGDTLWDIANKYLAHPWEWQALWHANPQIKNPKRLYPGAVLALRYYKQNPYLKVLSNGTIKLSPYMRPMPLHEPIPPIPLRDIKPFLNASLVMNQNRLKKAPYIVAFKGERLRGGQGDEVYVKNLHPSEVLPKGATISYAIYRPHCPYYSRNHKVLGYKATLVGYGELVQGGEPAILLLTDIVEGIKLKDRVMLNDYPEFKLNFEPKAPKHLVKGTIIDLPPYYTQGASGLVAMIDQGQNAGLEPGDVLAIYARPRKVSDPVHSGTCVTLPRERVGELLIFRTFSKTSFGLVVRSISVVHLHDGVTNP